MSSSNAPTSMERFLHREGLPSALAFFARQGGVEIDPEDVAAALGLSYMICASDEHGCPGFWAGLAHDAFLVEAGRLFGLTVRGLHPPSAARGLASSPEFDQHFDASYKPLIERALEHDQPVIAWCQSAKISTTPPSWRLISGTCSEGVGFVSSGFELEAAGPQPPGTPLEKPALQVYVVESIEPVRPSSEALAEVVIDRARRLFNNEIAAGFGVVSGPAAVDKWIGRIGSGATCDGCRGAVASCHSRLAAALVNSHESAIRFLDRHAAAAADGDRELIKTLRSAFSQIARALGESIEGAREWASSPEKASKVTGPLANVRAATVTAQTALLARAKRCSDTGGD